MNHKDHLEEIAQVAASLYGQDWKAIPGWTKDRWREAVRNTNRAGGDNDMDRIAGQAIDEWYKKQEAPAAVEATPETPVIVETTPETPKTTKKPKGVK